MSIKLKSALPGPKSQMLMEKRNNVVSKGPFHVTPIFISKACGSYVEDVDGNTLLDFASGIGVNNLGYQNQEVTKAIHSQVDLFLHSSFNVLPYELYINVCEKLNQITPGNFKKKTFLANSGAEAVENAVKIARQFTKKQAVICFDHAFHGRTFMAMSLSSKANPYKNGCGPFMSEVYRTAFPYEYRWPNETSQLSKDCFDQFKNLVTHQVGINHTACVIIEPVCGEGGFISAPPEFLKLLTEFCKTNNIVMIADEIQTGFGRTGHLFASLLLGFEPDIITTAKGIANGMPLSAVTGRADIMDSVLEGSIGGTYGGNPVSCSAALAVIKELENGSILSHFRSTGEHLLSRLLKWKDQYEVIGDVRGLGSMLAIEFVKNKKSKEAYPEFAKKLVCYSYQNGLILMSSGTLGNVIRFLMPITINPKELNEGLDLIENGIKKLI